MLNQFALALARPIGFFMTIATVVTGFAVGIWLGWPEGWLFALHLYLTTLPIIIGGIMLVAQRRDTEAVQAKLDELIGATQGARNEMIRSEDKSHTEIEELRK